MSDTPAPSPAPLISIDDAIEQDLFAIRKPEWPEWRHLALYTKVRPPYARLYSPTDTAAASTFPLAQFDRAAKLYEPYTGLLADTEEYKAVQMEGE